MLARTFFLRKQNVIQSYEIRVFVTVQPRAKIPLRIRRFDTVLNVRTYAFPNPTAHV